MRHTTCARSPALKGAGSRLVGLRRSSRRWVLRLVFSHCVERGWPRRLNVLQLPTVILGEECWGRGHTTLKGGLVYDVPTGTMKTYEAHSYETRREGNSPQWRGRMSNIRGHLCPGILGGLGQKLYECLGLLVCCNVASLTKQRDEIDM